MYGAKAKVREYFLLVHLDSLDGHGQCRYLEMLRFNTHGSLLRWELNGKEEAKRICDPLDLKVQDVYRPVVADCRVHTVMVELRFESINANPRPGSGITGFKNLALIWAKTCNGCTIRPSTSCLASIPLLLRAEIRRQGSLSSPLNLPSPGSTYDLHRQRWPTEHSACARRMEWYRTHQQCPILH